MDQEKFDALVQKLTADASRRGVVRGAVTGAVGSALAAVGLQSASAEKKKGKKAGNGKNGKGKDEVSAEACLPAGSRCRNGGKRKNPNSPGRCSRCCTDASSRASGKLRCCQEDGTACSANKQCCTGSCIDNICGPVS